MVSLDVKKKGEDIVLLLLIKKAQAHLLDH